MLTRSNLTRAGPYYEAKSIKSGFRLELFLCSCESPSPSVSECVWQMFVYDAKSFSSEFSILV